MYRLGLTDSDKYNRKVSKQIQEVGNDIAKAVGERIINVEYVFYLYGSGGVHFLNTQSALKYQSAESAL